MNPLVGPQVAPAARVFVILGVTLGAAFSAMLVLFVSGEILTDPGGLVGLGLVLAWLVLPVLLSALALLTPHAAYPVLVVMVAVVVLASLATIPWAGPVWEFEDTHGPINLMVLIAALIPLVALGRSMPRHAGWLMIALMVGSIAFQAVSLLLADQWSVILVFAVLMVPFIAVAVLFVIAGANRPRVTHDT